MKYLLGTDFVIPGRNEVTPTGRTDINIYNITVKGLSDRNTAIIVVYSPGTLVPEYPGLRCENRWDRRHTIIVIIIHVMIWFLIVFYCNRGWKKFRTFIAGTFGIEPSSSTDQRYWDLW